VRDPCGRERGRMGPGRAGGNPGELSPAQLRSSIRASLPGRAQGQFSGELGTAHVSEPAYQTCELPEISVGQGIAGLSRPTKHTQREDKVYVGRLEKSTEK
jgi:hypothetical protein